MLMGIKKLVLISLLSVFMHTTFANDKAKMLANSASYCTIFSYFNEGDIPKNCPKLRKTRGMENKTIKRGVIAFQSIYFNYNQANVSSESFEVLDTIVAVIQHQKMRNKMIRIEGHTDVTGTETYNQLLSNQRAIAVKNYLIQQGVQASRLTTKGYGFNHLYDTEHPKDGINRRVEFINLTL